MTTASALDLTLLLDYFEQSSFEYLALELNDQQLTLQRAPTTGLQALTAPSIGTVAPAQAQGALPRPGEHVALGQTLVHLRRFKTVVEVVAPCAGTIAAVDVESGQFVEYGQRLFEIATP